MKFNSGIAPHHHHPTPAQRLMALVRTEQRDLGAVVIWSIAVGLLSIAVPVGVQALVNTVAFGTVLQPLVILTILVAAALGTAAVLQLMRQVAVEIVQRRIFVRLASDVVNVLLRSRYDNFDRQHAPELVNRFLDVVTVQKAFSILLIEGLTLLMQVLVSLALLAVYHPYLLVFDLFLVFSIGIILFVLGRGAVRTSIAESYAKYDVLAWLEEVARHPVTFRGSGGRAYAIDRANTLVTSYVAQRAGHFRVLLRQIAGSLALQAFALAALLGVGGWLVLRGELTLGQLVAAELVLGAALNGFTKFGKSLESFYDLQAAMDKLGHVTDLPLERSTGEALARRSGPAPVRLESVSFNYADGTDILKQISLEVPAGAKIAIHGRGGGGKSTLLDLIYGLRESSTGRIELDHVDYRDVRLEDIRGSVALVRSPEVFPGSVFENIRLGGEADVTEVREALASAGVLEPVLALPQGMQTPLATGGNPLSPSQAVRIKLARAILSKPRVLLLDEMLDLIGDLDPKGALIRTLFAPDAPWTLIVTTSDPTLWPLFDRVYRLDSGRLYDDWESARPAGAGVRA